MSADMRGEALTKLGRVSLIGLGLIGGSLGMALYRSGAAEEIIGYDLLPEAGQEALARKAVHLVAPDLETAFSADLVILAVSVEKIPCLIETGLPHLRPGVILTDVASTKTYLSRLIPKMLPPGIHYVGGHPMAGTERSGIEAADPFLFENAVYILTPGADTPRFVLDYLRLMVKSVGGLPHLLSPEEHDLMVAAVSHLPHLTAAALVNTAFRVEEKHPGAVELAAGGFRDSTRIARGAPSLWREIFASNRLPLLEVLDIFLTELTTFRDNLRLAKDHKVEAALSLAAAAREELPIKNKGFLTLLHELVAVIEDRPGAIAGVVGILAQEELNIKDIEILRIREGEGGTLRLAFEDADTLTRALVLLSSEGYQVRARGEK